MLVDVVADHVVARRHRPHRQRQPHVALPDDDHGLGGHALHHDRRDHPRRPRARFLGSVRSRPTYPRRTVPSMSAEPPAPLDRRALLRRMAIGGAAVWATPMMQSVASAQAAASCGTAASSTGTPSPPGSIFTSTIIGNTTVTIGDQRRHRHHALPDNGRILGGPAGGHQPEVPPLRDDPDNGTATGASARRSPSPSAPRSRTCRFRLFDIDDLTNGWGDELFINTTPATRWSIPGGQHRDRKGTGGQHQPVPQQQRRTTTSPTPATPGNLNIRLRRAAHVVRFTYRNGNRAGRRRTSRSA